MLIALGVVKTVTVNVYFKQMKDAMVSTHNTGE